MQNQIYRVKFNNSNSLELGLTPDNEGLEVVFNDDNIEIAAILDEKEIDSLIEYLCACKAYIEELQQNKEDNV